MASRGKKRASEKGKERVPEDQDECEEEQGPVRTKRRKVVISRVYEGLDRYTLVPKDASRSLSDVVEDIEEYEVEELYPCFSQDKQKGPHVRTELVFTVQQPAVTSTRNHENTLSTSECEGDDLSFGQNILSYTDGDIAILVPDRAEAEEKDILDQYTIELDASADPRLAEKTQNRLARDNPHRDHYGSRSMLDLGETLEEGEILEATDFQRVRNAFAQVPGRPNCYSFGGYEGKGFSGCGVVDPFSLPIMYERHDFHMWSWENEVYDYMTYNQYREYEDKGKGIPSLREIKKIARESLKMDSRNILREVNMLSKTRESAAQKLSYLFQQLVEFTHERAFHEKGLTDQNILVYRGDPSARVVFLMKAPNYYDTRDCDSKFAPKLSRSEKSNGLGSIQKQLYFAMREQIMEFYKRSNKSTTIADLNAAIKHVLPILTGDCSPDGYDSGVAFLYCVPIHDPEKWGKKRHEQESKEHGLGGYQPYGAQKEFPTNVLTFMDYARIALRIISPIVVVSTSRFTTQCLSAGMDPKKIPGMTSAVDKCKWFTIRLATEGSKSGSGASTTCSSASKAAVKMVYDSETKQMVRQRLDAWCIRGEHPFVIRNNGYKMLSEVKTLTQRIAAKLFSEYDMPAFLMGRANTMTSFCFGTSDPKAKEVERKDKLDVPDRQIFMYGNYLCKSPSRKHIEHYRTNQKISIIMGVCEEECEEEQMSRLDELTRYGKNETPCMKVCGGSIGEFPQSIARSEFWKVDLPVIIHQACLYPGVELVKNLRELKTKTSVATLVIRTKSIKTTDPKFFETVPRYPGVISEEGRETNRVKISQRLKEYKAIALKREEKRREKGMGINRFIASKRKEAMKSSKVMSGGKDDPFEQVYYMLDEEQNGDKEKGSGEKGIRKFDSWYSMLFTPRVIVDTTTSLDHLNALGSIDYAVFYDSVLEMIEYMIFCEAHRMVHEEQVAAGKGKGRTSSRKKKGPPPFLTMGQIVKMLGQRFFGHSECTLNSEANEDVQLQWIDMLSEVGMQVKEALKKYVQALL